MFWLTGVILKAVLKKLLNVSWVASCSSWIRILQSTRNAQHISYVLGLLDFQVRLCFALSGNPTKSVHRKKHYTRGVNTSPYKLARLVTFESLKWIYSFATNSTLFMKLGALLHVRCRHRSVKTASTAVEQEISFPANKQRIQLWNSESL